jgi:hypothetical protein
MNKIVVFCFVGLLLVGCVSGYMCIDGTDNQSVADFKNKINILSVQNDIAEHNLTEEAFYIKLKYFNPCKW